MNKKYLIIFIFFLFISFNVEATRPNYSFSDEVFKDLPVFPNDFYDIKKLYDSQKITALQLGEEYLQPEILPSWNYFANKTYDSNKQMGSYGMFCYPSWVSVSNVSAGDNFTISTLIYAQWGIRFYQGVRLGLEHPQGINVFLSKSYEIKLMEEIYSNLTGENIVFKGESSNNILLSPTYPSFKRGWMQVIEFYIEVNETGEYLINLTATKPIEEYESKWDAEYPDEYISGFGMLAMKTPRFQIEIHPPPSAIQQAEDLDEISTTSFIGGYFAIFIFSMLLALLVIGWYYAKKRKKME